MNLHTKFRTHNKSSLGSFWTSCIFASILCVLSFAGCELWNGFDNPLDKEGYFIHITAISLSKSDMLLEVEETDQLGTSIVPTNADNKDITWSSTNTSIATVSSTGIVTGLAPGKVSVVATTVDGGIQASCEVSVVIPVPLTGVGISKTASLLAVGDTDQLSPVFQPIGATNRKVSWESSNTAVATISPSGLVTAIALGTATITLTTADKGLTASSTVNVVTIVPVASIYLSEATVPLLVGGNKQLLATFVPSNVTNKKVSWATSDETIATVSPAGLVHGLASGIVTITVITEDQGKQAECIVTVTAPIAVSSVTMNKSSTSIGLGRTEQLEVTVTPTNATNKAVIWVSGNETVATVSQTGLVTAVAISSEPVLISVTSEDGNKTADCLVSVVPVAVAGISLSKTLSTILIGSTDQLTATISPSDATNKTMSWQSSHPEIATVSSTGLVTGIALGSATITVTTEDGEKSAACTVTIAPIAVTGVSLNKTTAPLVKGDTVQLLATIVPANATIKTIEWTSNDEAIATVSSSGMVEGIEAGMTTITATSVNGGMVASCRVKVSLTLTTDVYFTDDFEDGMGKWTVSSYDWAVVDTTSRSGSHSATDSPSGNYLQNSDSSMTLTNKIDLTSALAPVLSYWHTISLAFNKDFTGAISRRDYGNVEISQDGGLNWVQLKSYSTITTSTWAREVIDLSPYAGQFVKIRYRLWDDPGSPTADGWVVDDIEIREVDSNRIAYPFFDNFENGTENWALTDGSDWQLADSVYRSAGHSITESPDGNYPSASSSQLILKHPMNLSSAIAPVLSYWHTISLAFNKDFTGAISRRDYGNVEISQDEGLNWILLKSYSVISISNWVNEIIDLSPYRSESVLIRFWLSDDTGSPTADGWVIDDIFIGEL